MPAASDADDLTLPHCFDAAQRAVQASGSGHNHQQVVATIHRGLALVQSEGLFSPNEEVDDVPTASLRFLLLRFFLAEALTWQEGRKPAGHLQLAHASLHHQKYLQQCRALRLQPPGLAQGPEQEESTPASLREQKIARFRAAKQLRSRVEAFQARRQPEAVRQEDEEDLRDYWLARIQLACLAAADQAQSLKQEIALLQHAEQLGPEDSRAQPAPPQPPEDLLAQLRLAAASLEAPRSQIPATLLRPGHNLPTRSLREQADIEMERMRAAEARQAEAARTRVESDEDDDDWVHRQRAKDDWKDEHPTGWGNSKLRPCA